MTYGAGCEVLSGHEGGEDTEGNSSGLHRDCGLYVVEEQRSMQTNVRGKFGKNESRFMGKGGRSFVFEKA